jgi:Fe-S-cluster containining protein
MNYTDKNLCSKCQGKCCKNLPGSTIPEDFNLSDLENELIQVLQNNYCVDCYDSDSEQLFYIRPRIKGINHIIDFNHWSGECIFLTETGCQLNENKRPYNCKMLEPVQNMHCKIHNNAGRYDSAIKWKKYRNVIDNVLKLLGC